MEVIWDPGVSRARRLEAMAYSQASARARGLTALAASLASSRRRVVRARLSLPGSTPAKMWSSPVSSREVRSEPTS